MHLHSSPKIYGKGIHRVMTAAETFRCIKPFMPKVGITRLADITGLDNIGIPTYSAIVPKSSDVLSVYNGKGVTKIDAKAGAVMEAIERHAALTVDKEFIYGTFSDLSKQRQTLDPRCTGIELHPKYDDDKVLAWVEGFDLLNREPILIPVELAGFNLNGKYAHPCYVIATTNGLASGNTLEEAICHALCELIERDAWTIAELLSHWLPYAKHKQQLSNAPLVATINKSIAEYWDDTERYPSIDLSQVTNPIKGLLEKFHSAGLHPIVKDITSDLDIPTVLSIVTEVVAPDSPLAHFGLGTHPDVSVAITRALTEVAQSRVVDIQGVREDISLATADNHLYMPHTKRVSGIDRRSWYYCESSKKRHFSQIQSYIHSDILDDIQLILFRLRERGLKQVVAVDLTKQEINVPVVRIVIPGLESWAADRKGIGWRATEHWRRNSG